jgi:ATP dependent DNA ligase domain
MTSKFRHNLSPCKSACVLGLTSRFEAAGGLLRNLVDHSHIRQKACGLWGFGHWAVVLTCFNQCARCPPEWASEPGSIPHPNPELHYARLCCQVRLSSGMSAFSNRRRVQGSIPLQPCIPRRAHSPPNGDGWVHEIKHDGFRILARREGDRIRLFTRNGYDFAVRFPKIALAVAASPVRSCVVDGERSSSIGRGLRQDARSPWHLTSAFRRISQMCYKSVSGCAMTCART